MPTPLRSNRIPAKPKPTAQAQVLAKVPRRTMTAEEQLAALAQVQKQAEQRVKLGQQLFKAAEQRLSGQGDILEQVKQEQDKLREQVQQDVAQSLQSYDQWMGRIDEGFTKAIAQLDERLDKVEHQMAGARGEMETMLEHAGSLLEQTQRLLSEAFDADNLDTVHARADGHPPSVPPAPVIDPNAEPQASDTDKSVADDAGPGVFGELLDQLRQSHIDDDHAA